jgi:nucleotide-binding universal stress UspA family protein
MFPIRTILLPNDFSPQAQAALELACALARDHGSRVIVLHVAEPPLAVYGEDGLLLCPPEGWREQAKAQLAALQPPDVKVVLETRLAEGEAAPEILRAAEAAHADLIVMGTHGRRGLSRLVMGSVAEAVLRKAPCPVLTVKTPFPETSPAPEPEPQAAFTA